ncbi:acetyltransferase [Escherichia coli]|uniref:acetyltransferase n=4 Tax=Escherichia coli TaxID=562 RepID=UPI00333B39AE
MSGSAFAVTHHAFSSGAGRTADRNRSHWSTSKTPSYTKSVSWQHHRNGVKIGFATEIKNAVIEAEATIGPQCFIADSVVANQAYLGAQVRTSNHRLDEQPVSVRTPEGIIATGCDKLGCYIGQRSRLGVQVIILPGRIISPNTQLGPRVIVERNLPAGTYSLRQELIRTGD